MVIIFQLGKKMASPFEGFMAAALMALMATPIYFSLEARGYSLLILLTTLSLFFRFEKRVKWLIVTNVLLCWTNYFGIFFVCLQVAVDFFKNRKEFKIHIIPFLSLLPIASLIWFQIQNGPAMSRPENFPDISWLLFETQFEIFSYLLALFFLFSLFWIRSELAVFAVAPFLFLVGWSYLIKPIYNERYLVTILSPAYLLVALALGRLRGHFPRTILTLSIGALIPILLSWYQMDLRQTSSYPRWKEALAYISQSQRSTKVLLINDWERDLWEYASKEYPEVQLRSHLRGESDFWFIDVSFEKSRRPGLADLSSFDKEVFDMGLSRMIHFQRKP